MNLTSCDNCGVVIDVDKIIFPVDLYGDDGAIDGNLAVWTGHDFVPAVPCPVCKESITKGE